MSRGWVAPEDLEMASGLSLRDAREIMRRVQDYGEAMRLGQGTEEKYLRVSALVYGTGGKSEGRPPVRRQENGPQYVAANHVTER